MAHARIKVAIAGAMGRMGQALIAGIGEFPGLRLAGGYDRPEHPHAGKPVGPGRRGPKLERRAQSVLCGADVLIDFTSPSALAGNLTLAARHKVAVLVGTTGLRRSDHDAIDKAALDIPVLQAANTSLGVNLLASLTRRAAERLGADWDIEILELHHARKVDAPSGTALMLGRAAAKGRGVALDDVAVRARDGITGPRRPGSIGFAVLRGGTAAGEHEVMFAGPDERIELIHRAGDRRIFARGALTAAAWLATRPPGRYTMADVLDI